VIIDSNVIVSAMRSNRGHSYSLVSNIGRDPRWRLSISGPLLQEYTEQVFAHAPIPGWSRTHCDNFLDYICASATWSDVYFLWRPLLPDPDDHMVLEAAVAASAQFIISFNKNDLAAAEGFGIQIVTPREFMLHYLT
jgi:predicted nucleic acid-binding protein